MNAKKDSCIAKILIIYFYEFLQNKKLLCKLQKSIKKAVNKITAHFISLLIMLKENTSLYISKNYFFVQPIPFINII